MTRRIAIRSSGRRRLGVMTLAVMTVAIAGCMEYESSRSEPVQRVLDENQVTYDLGQPLTREEVGLTEGRPVMAIGHTGGTPLIAVTIILPDDRTFEVDTSVVNITAWTVDEDDGQPTSIELSYTHDSVDAAAAELEANAEVLGLDRSALQSWRRTAGERMADADDPTTRGVFSRAFTGATVGDVQISAEAWAYPSVGEVGVSYSFSWGEFWDDEQ